MDNRKALHDNSLIMICLAVLDVFTFLTTTISSIVDGSIKETLNTVEPDLVNPVKVVFVIVNVMVVILTLSGAFIGFKGLKVSREPNADKGYITAAKVFLALNVIALVAAIVVLFDKNTNIIDGIITLASTAADVTIYVLFIKAAKTVRQDAMKKA